MKASTQILNHDIVKAKISFTFTKEKYSIALEKSNIMSIDTRNNMEPEKTAINI